MTRRLPLADLARAHTGSGLMVSSVPIARPVDRPAGAVIGRASTPEARRARMS